jgi:hypothetical protein
MLIGEWIKDADGKLVLAWKEQKQRCSYPALTSANRTAVINPMLQAALKTGASLPASVTPCQGRRTAGAVTCHYAAAGLRGHAIGDACAMNRMDQI